MIYTPHPHRQQVQSYINTCGIVDPSARQRLHDFSDGIYDLGLWNSMVCWPMRSSQNFGKGTVVQSLGGLGSYGATFGATVPTWGINGLIKIPGNDASVYVPAIDVALAGQWSIIAIASITSVHSVGNGFSLGTFSATVDRSSGSATLYFYSAPSAEVPLSASFSMSGGDGERNCRVNGGTGYLSGTGFRYFSGTGGPSPSCASLLTIDGVAASTFAGTGTAYANGAGISDSGTKYGYLMGVQNPASNTVGLTHSFSSFFSTMISPANNEQLRNLYKSTLGQGLSLP